MNLQLLASLCLWALVSFAAIHSVCVLFTLWLLRQRSIHAVAENELPKVAVFLCIRGADPGLADNLKRLIAQQYPRFQLFIVVDSEQDPAWDMVRQIVQDSPQANVQVSPLRNRRTTCGLKCSALVQMLDELDDSWDVVALADADLKSHPTWLTELVTPLSDPTIGATFGNRWFMPAKGWMGSTVRQLTNAIGVVVMPIVGIPWAGSLAIKMSVVRNGNLREMWSNAIVDDGPVRVIVKRQKKKLRFIPSLMMTNTEDCDLRFAGNFQDRQLKWTRTYSTDLWPLMIVYTLTVLLMVGAAPLLAIACATMGRWQEAALFAFAFSLYGLNTILLWIALDLGIRRIIARRGEQLPSLTIRSLLRLPLALMLAGGVQIRGTLRATVGNRISWRGVTYRIDGPWSVQLLDDSTLTTETPGTAEIGTGVSL